MAALATDPNRRRRLIVELLARTGMRAGEIGGLGDDAMYRLGDTHWLRIPFGKLHNDRSVPLHPLLVGLINDYRTWRGPTDDRAARRTQRRPALRPAHHPPLRPSRRQARRRRPRASPPASPHPRHAVPQPRHEPRSHRRAARPPLTADDPHLRTHRRHRRRRPVLQCDPRRREPKRSRPLQPTTTNAATSRTPPPTPRQRTLHATARARLQVPDHLRRLRLLRHRREFVAILPRQRDDAADHVDLARTQLYDDIVRVIDEQGDTPSH